MGKLDEKLRPLTRRGVKEKAESKTDKKEE